MDKMSTPDTNPDRDPDFFDGDEPRISLAIPSVGWLLAFGDNDWIFWALTKPDILETRVRLDPWGDRITITGMALLADPDEALSASQLRDLPLGRLETTLNQRRLATHIRYLRVNPGVNTGFDFSPSIGEIDWDLFGHTPVTFISPYEIPGAQATTKRPDAFYAAVADGWTSATLNNEPSPAEALATANGVTTSAVHRWIREARRRGLMVPSSRATRTARHGAAATDTPPAS